MFTKDNLFTKANMFRVIVYCIALYLILTKGSITINLVGWIILISHIYKDITNLLTWPEWCEYCGLALAILLIRSGLDIHNYFIVFLGVCKSLAHLRQFILQDNRYYY